MNRSTVRSGSLSLVAAFLFCPVLTITLPSQCFAKTGLKTCTKSKKNRNKNKCHTYFVFFTRKLGTVTMYLLSTCRYISDDRTLTSTAGASTITLPSQRAGLMSNCTTTYTNIREALKSNRTTAYMNRSIERLSGLEEQRSHGVYMHITDVYSL